MRIIFLVVFTIVVVGLFVSGVVLIKKEGIRLPQLPIKQITTLTQLPILDKGDYEIATVSSVIDGDTIILTDKTHVRYIGMNTPEIANAFFKKKGECFGNEATQENKKLVEGKTIKMQKDVSDIDKYGRKLRYVWVPSTSSGQAVFVNDILVKEGYAKVDTVPPDTKYQTQFKLSAIEAEINQRGLWNACK